MSHICSKVNISVPPLTNIYYIFRQGIWNIILDHIAFIIPIASVGKYYGNPGTSKISSRCFPFHCKTMFNKFNYLSITLDTKIDRIKKPKV